MRMVTLMRLWGFIRGASVIIISTITALWLLQGIPVVAGTGGFTHVDDVHDSAYGMPTRPRVVGVRGMSIQVFPIFGLVK